MDIVAPSVIPNLQECAILLDVDGTIVDLAPTPREVWVPPDLANNLNSLLRRSAGALALVSGRSLNDIDLIFAPEVFPSVGGHGAEMRRMLHIVVDAVQSEHHALRGACGRNHQFVQDRAPGQDLRRRARLARDRHFKDRSAVNLPKSPRRHSAPPLSRARQAASSSARIAANTSRNIASVSTPVFVL